MQIQNPNSGPVEPNPNVVIIKPKTIKDLCALRYKIAVMYTVIFEYILLVLLFLIININPFQPFGWILESFRKFLSRFFLPLLVVPLTGAVFFNGFFLTYTYLAKNGGNRTRVATFIRKTLHLVVTLVTGLMFTWIYLRLIPKDYNAGYLTDIVGLAAALRYFYNNVNFKLTFPCYNQPHYLRAKDSLILTIKNSCIESCLPSLTTWIIIVAGITCYNFKINTLSSLFGIRIFIYVWLEFIYVTMALTLIREIFNIAMTDEQIGRIRFNITYNAFTENDIPLAQLLMAYDIFLTATRPGARSDYFYNGNAWQTSRVFSSWNFHKVLDKFTKDLNALIEENKLETIQNKPANTKKQPINSPFTSPITSPATARTTYRDLNETLGIRNLLASPVPSVADYDQPRTQPLPAYFAPRLEAIQNSVCSSVYDTICAKLSLQEDKSKKINTFLAENSNRIIWVLQAFVNILVYSLTEDRNGSVKLHLNDHFRYIVELQQVVEKINTMNLVMKKADRNYSALRSALKMSLFRIGKTFEPYFDDITVSPDVLDYIKANMLC